MKQKNYPVKVCGHNAAATVEVFWNKATISFKFSHRKGQKVIITHLEDEDKVWIDEYPTYTAIRFFSLDTCDFPSERSAINFCKGLIDTVDYAVNFDAKEELVTKELMAIYG